MESDNRFLSIKRYDHNKTASEAFVEGLIQSPSKFQCFLQGPNMEMIDKALIAGLIVVGGAIKRGMAGL